MRRAVGGLMVVAFLATLDAQDQRGLMVPDRVRQAQAIVAAANVELRNEPVMWAVEATEAGLTLAARRAVSPLLQLDTSAPLLTADVTLDARGELVALQVRGTLLEVVRQKVADGARPTADVLVLKYFEALQAVANGQATKVFLPSDPSGLLQQLAGLAEVARDVPGAAPNGHPQAPAQTTPPAPPPAKPAPNPPSAPTPRPGSSAPHQHANARPQRRRLCRSLGSPFGRDRHCRWVGGAGAGAFVERRCRAQWARCGLRPPERGSEAERTPPRLRSDAQRWRSGPYPAARRSNSRPA